MARRHFLVPLLQNDPGSLELRNDRNGRLIARTLMTAFDSRSRRQGLLGRGALPQSTALVIAPCNAVHTFFMRFAIDVIFADRSGTVVGIAHELRPWRIWIGLRAFAAIELPAGSARAVDVRAGDRLTLDPGPSGQVRLPLLAAGGSRSRRKQQHGEARRVSRRAGLQIKEESS